MRPNVYIVCAVILMVSCNADPRARATKVSGTVTVNGQPLNTGEVVFHPEDRSLGADSGKIEGGQFKFLASTGRKRVEVRASRELPPPPGGSDPTYEELIPRLYNKEQTLWIEVASSGPNHFDITIEGTMGKNSR